MFRWNSHIETGAIVKFLGPIHVKLTFNPEPQVAIPSPKSNPVNPTVRWQNLELEFASGVHGSKSILLDIQMLILKFVLNVYFNVQVGINLFFQIGVSILYMHHGDEDNVPMISHSLAIIPKRFKPSKYNAVAIIVSAPPSPPRTP